MSEEKTPVQTENAATEPPPPTTEPPPPTTDMNPGDLPVPKPTATGPKEDTQLITNGQLKSPNGAKKPYPKSVFFIVGNEFCERFSYYGMRAILVLYMTNSLNFNKDVATAIYHSFIMLCYFMPIFGAILADGYLNKYRTILYLSIVYACGNVIMTFTAFPPPFWVGPMIGLFLIGVGTGGIKPCVSAFGGDQFSSDQEKQRSQFFSVFYFTINFGSFLSMVITPLIRENTQCFGSSCYPVAFGIPAILMMIALALFWFGRTWYRIYPPSGSVIKDFFCCIGKAIKNRCKSGSEQKDHWLDYAEDIYEPAFLHDVRCVLRTFVLFIPLPVFWALFDQQGSRWTLQSVQLDRQLGPNWYLPPDQIQAINPVLILLFIPIFEVVVYPLIDKCRIPNRPLQRMVAGMLFAALAFVVAGFLQLKIDSSLWFPKPSAGQSSLDFVNLSPCPLDIGSPWTNASLGPVEQTEKYLVDSRNHSLLLSPSIAGNSSCLPSNFMFQEVQLTSEKAYHFVTTVHRDSLQSKLFEHPIQRPSTGGSLVGILFAGDLINQSAKVTLQETERKESYTYQLADFEVTKYEPPVAPGRYHVTLDLNSTSIRLKDFECRDGAIYTLAIYSHAPKTAKFEMLELQEVPPASVSIWLQLPQYLIITVGEVLFAITGLAFTYSQAPESMKSVVQAGWLLTTAFGNLIDVIVAGVRIPSQAVEFFFFAILMGLMTVIFAIMAYFYKYVNVTYLDTDAQTDDTQDLTSSAAPISLDPVNDVAIYQKQ